jgi:hypothetical protein
MEKAKTTPKPFILVTDDTKDDWWLEKHGKTIGPRPELVEEILSKGATSFYMYRSHRFLTEAGKFFKFQVNEDAVQEIRNTENFLDKIISVNRELSSKNITNKPFVGTLDSLELGVLEAMLEDQVTADEPIGYYQIKMNLYRLNYRSVDINLGIRSLQTKGLIKKGKPIDETGLPSFTMTQQAEQMIIEHIKKQEETTHQEIIEYDDNVTEDDIPF